jgi:hypothetical protein
MAGVPPVVRYEGAYPTPLAVLEGYPLSGGCAYAVSIRAEDCSGQAETNAAVDVTGVYQHLIFQLWPVYVCCDVPCLHVTVYHTSHVCTLVPLSS